MIVADDDAAVVWFLAGVLKAAGATVFEARDGERALELAKHCEPDLVITDILMPGLDGFALCRALKRDVVLRDVPTILLSWKEDLLQRMRELGADADGYLRKEASAGVVVQRARELVARRQRVTRRVETQAEPRGRLDGMTVHSLLRIVASSRPDATVRVIDASHLYELELRAGRPVRATRSGAGGELERGASVLAALLSVGDGRFVVTAPREDAEIAAIPWDFAGSLSDLFAPTIASVRAARGLLGAERWLRVARVEFESSVLKSAFASAPERVRLLVQSLLEGAPPRALVTGGAAPAWLLEDVLDDVASRGGVLRILDDAGNDVLAPATDAELGTLRGVRASSGPIDAIGVPGLEATLTQRDAPIAVDLAGIDSIVEAALGRPLRLDSRPVRPESERMLDRAAALHEDPWTTDDESMDSSLFEASPGEAADSEPSPLPPSGPRLVTPAPSAVVEEDPDVVATGARASDIDERRADERRVEEREVTPTPSRLPPPPGLQPMLSLGSLHPPPVYDVPATPRPPKNTRKSPSPAPVSSKQKTPAAAEVTPRFPLPSAYLPPAPAPTKKDPRLVHWVLFAMLGVGFAVWARWSRERTAPSETQLLANAVTPAATVVASPSPAADGAGAAKNTPTNGSQPSGEETRSSAAPSEQAAVAKPEEPAEDLPLRDSDEVKKGHGMLEIVAGKSDSIYLDGKAIGSGPVLSAPVRSRREPYEITIKTRNEERTRSVVVREGRLTRLRMAPPWQR